MSQPTGLNPLLQPPFFLIPGIHPSSPISAQTEQIDQLNTLLLQEIDANFARFHQIVTTRILPEIKRFAIAGEPTREAATFWKSFFEAAAAIRVPVAGDHSNVQTSPSQLETTTYNDQTLTLRADDSYLSPGQEDGAFMFQTGPTSSTPRVGGTGTADESWEDSIESPFDRVERRLREELRIGETGGYASSDAPTPSLPSGYDLPRLDGVGNSTYGDVSTGTVEPIDIPRGSHAAPRGRAVPVVSQSSIHEQTDTPKAARQRNPFGHATGSNSNSHSWNGITDLRSTPLNARFTKTNLKPNSKADPTTSGIHVPTQPSFDESDDDIRLNMSPPVTMTFNLPPRAQAVLNIARTPAKSAGPSRPLEKEGEARMILDDLMEEMERGYEPSPRMPTPEGLGRYSIVPGELGFAEGRTLFDGRGGEDGNETYQPGLPRKSMANTSFGSDGLVDPTQVQPVQGMYADDEDSFDVDDSFDSPVPTGPTGYTSTRADDSDLSLSPNTSEAGIIFGGPAQKPGLGRAGFSLMKPDEMMTYHGGRLEDAAGREVMDSPTHAVRGTQR